MQMIIMMRLGAFLSKHDDGPVELVVAVVGRMLLQESPVMNDKKEEDDNGGGDEVDVDY